ncbi:MAG: hypothetical protein GEU96_06240 [Propionibacteriales bacterium]|nr:hypothetical protein [Propionibacteriales bacterium]
MNDLATVLRRPADDKLAAAHSAAARVRRLHGGQSDTRTLETLPALSGLLPGGALRAGAAYSVTGSTALAMALMAGPSAAGAWCGVVGLPGFGAEAAAGLGVDLDRVVLVPEPGAGWRSALAALVDALTMVVVQPPADMVVTGPEASRLGARLRARGGVLVVCGTWPACEARLSVSELSWSGLGAGHGHLTGRQVTVLAQGRGTAVRPRRTRLWLPGADGEIRPVEDTPLVDPAEPGWVHEAAG